ncbi:host specificity factor TipJ family phage tail protein [Escherichia coli]|uniref:host specificity factor TipJ family phage tail protein n=9 Tax=Bacteria TaxID=2 RepID=UPI0038915DA5
MEPLREIRNRLLNGWQLSKMHTFEVAARHQSFALAAEELSLSPSAVSHRINQLEEELGIQLFVRSHRKVELTHEGKRVYWALKSSLDTLNQEILDIKNQELAGRDPNELDLEELYSISASIKAKNERLGWFDFSFDDKDISLGQRLQSICNVARVTVFRDGIKWRFVREEKKDIISAQFDARNLANDDTGGTLQFKGHLPTSFDGVELEWVDATDTNDDGTDKKAYIRLRIDAANKTILEEGSVRPYKVQLAGCRNKDQAMNRAQLEARRLIYQRTAVEDVALSDANFVQKGDRVRWADVYDEAVSSGEILQINGDVFTTSENLIFEAGKTYRVSITDPYGYPSPWITAAPVTGNPGAFQADFHNAYTADNINSMLGSRFILTPSVASDPMDFVLTEKSSGEDPTQIKISLSQYDERMFDFDYM